MSDRATTAAAGPQWATVPDDEVERGAAWLRAQLAASGQGCFVIGLSGGIDSAVTAAWAARAVGAERLILAAMPYGLAAPSRFPASHPASLADARLVAEGLPGADFRVLDVAPAVDAVAESTGLAAELARSPDDADLARYLGNVKARLRAVHLRYLANRHRGLVLGTENRTEHLLGYFTVGGDEESDLELLSPYLKAQVRVLAARLGVPQPVRDKAPSADLYVGQTDEGELGYTYATADAVLAATGGDPSRASAALDGGIDSPAVARVLDRVAATAFKRNPKASFRGGTPAHDGHA